MINPGFLIEGAKSWKRVSVGEKFEETYTIKCSCKELVCLKATFFCGSFKILIWYAICEHCRSGYWASETMDWILLAKPMDLLEMALKDCNVKYTKGQGKVIVTDYCEKNEMHFVFQLQDRVDIQFKEKVT
jgi:hypothetical protein